jgi:hypothetical protein
MGLGRTKASAARNPAQPRSAEVVLESIDGVLRVVLRFAGCIGEEVADRLWEKDGELWSSDIAETFLELGFRPSWSDDVGRRRSSTENIDRSSPFQRSPHSWLF